MGRQVNCHRTEEHSKESARTRISVEALLRRGRRLTEAPLRYTAASALAMLGFAAIALFTPRWIAFAQQAGRPAFEVASVKPNTSVSSGDFVRIHPGGTLDIQNVPLRGIIRTAYEVQDFQIADGPGWMNRERYDIVAKAQSDFSFDEMTRMLRTLLEDRFRLKVHRAKREGPVYELTLARSGLKIERNGNCVPRDPSQPLPSNVAGQKRVNYCGNVRGGRQTLDGEGIPIAAAADSGLASLSGRLSAIVGRTVIDKTGLTGRFDVHLQWSDEGLSARPGDAVEPNPSDDGNRPSLFTAVQEQLGLRLESAKGPVDVLVIDHVEKPDAN